MWHCPYKFDLDYYAIVDEKDNIVTTAINEKELPELKRWAKDNNQTLRWLSKISNEKRRR